MPEYI